MRANLLPLLACPLDRTDLDRSGSELHCAQGHRFPLVDGIPVLLDPAVVPNHGYLAETLAAAQRWRVGEPLGWEADAETAADGVDGWVQQEIVHTCGGLYTGLLGHLPRYPIPDWPWPTGEGIRLLDLGCNWGRWTIAAARAGHVVLGIDPSLRSLLAARRVAARLGVEADFVAADARALPLRSGAVARVFCYSVLQHFSREDLETTLREIARVLGTAGVAWVQMANRWGLRQRWAEWTQRRQAPGIFAVRRYAPRELLAIFEAAIGPSQLSVDGFFTLNAQSADLDLLPPRLRAVVLASDGLRRASERVPGLALLADSLWLTSRRRSGSSG